jgi:tRNA(adenine34) deaminase
MDYEFFMEKALIEAKKSLDNGNFPVGCILVYNTEIIASSGKKNTMYDYQNGNELDHAEIRALRKLSILKKKTDKENTFLFTTLEPCLMCLGASILNGIKKIVYAYEDVMGGASKCDLKNIAPLYDDNIIIVPQILRNKSLSLFKTFFSNPENTYLKGTMLEKYTLSQ